MQRSIYVIVVLFFVSFPSWAAETRHSRPPGECGKKLSDLISLRSTSSELDAGDRGFGGFASTLTTGEESSSGQPLIVADPRARNLREARSKIKSANDGNSKVFVWDFKTVADAREYQKLVVEILSPAVRAQIGNRPHDFRHAAAEDSKVGELREFRFNGVELNFRGRRFKSTKRAAGAYHLQAHLMLQVLLSPKTLLKSVQDLGDFESFNERREWMAVQLLDEANRWPNRRIEDKKLQEELLKHLGSVTYFDTGYRKNGSTYFSPTSVLENIALAQVWIWHHLSYIDVADQGLAEGFVYTREQVVEPAERGVALSIMMNFLELWEKQPDPAIRQHLEECIQDAAILTRTMSQGRVDSPEVDMMADQISRLIEEKLKRANREQEEAEVLDEEISAEKNDEVELQENPLEETTSKETFEKNDELIAEKTSEKPAAGSKKLARLALSGRELILQKSGGARQGWIRRLDSARLVNGKSNRSGKKGWKIFVSRKALKIWKKNGLEKNFREKVTAALASIIEKGYDVAKRDQGFPEIKRLKASVGLFGYRVYEFRMGTGRVLFRLYKDRHYFVMMDLDANHNVDYNIDPSAGIIE